MTNNQFDPPNNQSWNPSGGITDPPPRNDSAASYSQGYPDNYNYYPQTEATDPYRGPVNNQSTSGYYPYQDSPSSSEMTVTDWIITLIILAIPLVGVVMLFVWAFGDSGKKSQSNFAKATLIMYAAIFVITILFFFLFASMTTSLLNSIQ